MLFFFFLLILSYSFGYICMLCCSRISNSVSLYGSIVMRIVSSLIMGSSLMHDAASRPRSFD